MRPQQDNQQNDDFKQKIFKKNNNDRDKYKISKDDIDMVFTMYHNVPKANRDGVYYEDHYDEYNNALIKNKFYNEDEKYMDDIIEEKAIELDLKFINITNERNLRFDENSLRNEFDNNERVLFQLNGINYYIQKHSILRLGFENAYLIVGHIKNIYNQIGELTVKVYPAIEVIKVLGIVHKKYYNYVSYGTKIKNIPIRQFTNKIKLHPDILKLKPYKNLYATIEEDSENMHWIVGSLRKGEENYVKNMIRSNHVDDIFVGIGENLARFEDMPGIYYNFYDDKVPGDYIRYRKYISNTSKTVQHQFLTIDVINQHMHNDRTYIFHSTDVAYYIQPILNCEYREELNIIQYHTFNVYNDGDCNVKNSIYSLNIQGTMIKYKPNGNEHEYKHKHVFIHGCKITIQFIENLFEKGYKEVKVKKNYNYDIEFLNIIRVSKDMNYCTIRISREKGEGIVRFHSRYNNYINEGYLIEEVEYEDDIKKLGDFEVKEKLESEEFCSENFEKFMNWFNGTNKVLDHNVYTYKETIKYKNGMYFFKDDLFILKVYNHVEENKALPEELNRNELFFKKYKVEMKIKKEYINKILVMYRGLNIPEANIKNTVNSIINLGHEEWHMEIDYELALILAIFCARYVARMNKTIKKEVADNKNLYDDKEYQENQGFFRRIKNSFAKYERDAEEGIELISSVVNSKGVNNIIENQKIMFMDNFFNYGKLYLTKFLILINVATVSIKELFCDLTFEEKAVKNHGQDIYIYIKNQMQYNTFGSILKTGKDWFNKYKDELKKTTLEQNIETIKRSYYYLFASSPKLLLNYIYMFFVFFPIIASIFILCEFIIQTFSLKLIEALTNMRFFNSINLKERVFMGVIIIILNGINSHFNNTKTKHVFFLIINFYSILVFREIRIINLICHILMSSKSVDITRNSFIIFFICLSYLINKIYAYDDVEYVSKIVYNPGSCTMNDVTSMFSTLLLMYKSIEDYIRINKLTERNSRKFRILKINKPHVVHKVSAPNKMPLVQKSFKIDGHNVVSNEPLKLHDCFWCECEAVYRQIQSKIDYDDDIVKDFEIFAHKKLDSILDEPLSQIVGFDLQKYISKLGIKSEEFMQGYLDFQNYKKLIMAFKMHVKIDEKIYINYSNYKVKARNISAQNKRVKLLMGIVCEILMNILHEKEWCGPGSTNDEKCKIFEKWIKEIPDCGVVCADGSAFDSTQHAKLQEIVDNYAFNKVIKACPFLSEFAETSDFKKICEQESYTVFSKYFKYKCVGTQMSGRMNTCLGNTLRSYLYVEYIKYKMKQEYFFINTDNIREMVNGDDQIIFMRKALFDYYEKIAYKYVYCKEDKSVKHGLGQIAKIFDKYPEINGAEFLSCILLYDPVSTKCLMVRKLERFLQLTPFTFNNKFLNVNKFRYMNAKLMFDDAMNIISTQNNLSIYKIYAWKMYEIAYYELNRLQNKVKFSKKFLKKVEDRLNENRRKMGYKSYVSHTNECDRNNESDNYVFDQLYYKFLEKNFGVNAGDIMELINTISNINVDNYLEKYSCSIIDKLHHCDTIEQYNKTCNKLSKTKVDTVIKLQDQNMIISQYHNH